MQVHKIGQIRSQEHRYVKTLFRNPTLAVS